MPELTCCACGSPMARVARSLPQGQAMCHTCRRARRPEAQALELKRCAKCGRTFQQRQTSQRYCSVKCRGKGKRQAPTSQRGYGQAHKAERAKWKPVVDQGQAYCAEVVCLEHSRWIQPGTPWDLAHNREAGGYLGPAHRSCNRSEGARYKLGRTSDATARSIPLRIRREVL